MNERLALRDSKQDTAALSQLSRHSALAVLFAMFVGLSSLGGCALLPSEGVYWGRVVERARFQDTDSVQTPADRMHTFRRVVDQDARALVDDIDYILLRDRPSRLSRWHNY